MRLRDGYALGGTVLKLDGEQSPGGILLIRFEMIPDKAEFLTFTWGQFRLRVTVP